MKVIDYLIALGGQIRNCTITGATINALTLTANAIGFSISGGTTSKTLTVTDDSSVSGTNTGDQDLSDYAQKSYVDSAVSAAVLPAQAGNAGKFVQTDGENASWQDAAVLGANTFTDQQIMPSIRLTTGATDKAYLISDENGDISPIS